MPSPDFDQQYAEDLYYSTTNSANSSVVGPVYWGRVVTRHGVQRTVSVVTPGYKRMRRSLLPNNPYRYYRMSYKDPKQLFTATSRPISGGAETYWRFEMNCRHFNQRTTAELADTADDPSQKAINQVLDQIRLGKANAAVSLAEMHKTAALVAQSAAKIYKAIKALKSARFGDFAAALGLTTSATQVRKFYTGIRKATYKDYSQSLTERDGITVSPRKQEKFKYRKSFKTYSQRQGSNVSNFLSDTWLEYSYGWKPLLSDVYASAEATASLFVQHQSVVRVVSGASKCHLVRTYTVTPPNDQVTYTYATDSLLRVRYVVKYRIPDGALNLATAFGLTNPLVVAWELVPFSFVADWFLPIGDALEALDATVGLDFAGGVKTYTHKRTFSGNVRGHSATLGSDLWYNQSGGGDFERFEFDLGREVLHDFPSYGWPKPKDWRSVNHGLSAVALLQSLFLRGDSNRTGYLAR